MEELIEEYKCDKYFDEIENTYFDNEFKLILETISECNNFEEFTYSLYEQNYITEEQNLFFHLFFVIDKERTKKEKNRIAQRKYYKKNKEKIIKKKLEKYHMDKSTSD